MTDTAIREQTMPEIITEEYSHFRWCGMNHETAIRLLARAYRCTIKTIERNRRRGLALVVEEREFMEEVSATAVADLQQVARGKWKHMRKSRRENLQHLGLVYVDGYGDPVLTSRGKQTLKESA